MQVIKWILEFFLGGLLWVLEFYIRNIQEKGIILGLVVNTLSTSFVAMAVVSICTLYKSITEEKRLQKKGTRYEEKVGKNIEKYMGDKVYHNILLPLGNGDTTEIDMVFVNTKGIFCVECKYRSGITIECDTSFDDIWCIDGRGMDNPFCQNRNHVRHLNTYIEKEFGNPIPIWNVVVTNPFLRVKRMGVVTYKDFHKLSQGRFLLSMSGNGKSVLKDMKRALEDEPQVLSENDVLTVQNLLDNKCASERELNEHRMRMKYKSIEREMQ